MVPRHGPLFDIAQEAVANDEIMSLPPLLHKPPNFPEIVTTIRVAEDDEFAARLLNSLSQCRAVAFDGGVNYTGTVGLGNLDGAVL